MHETESDFAALQRLLDRSYELAGPHLRSIATPQHRVHAHELADRLHGMVLLTLATVTADGRPLTGAVDGIFYRGALHFGSSPDSVRLRHIRYRPQVSATHLPGEEFAVTVHGHAVELDLREPTNAGFRTALLQVYVPRYGPNWEEFLESGARYARIDPERMLTFRMEDEPESGGGLADG
jgi:hypothetical protein